MPPNENDDKCKNTKTNRRALKHNKRKKFYKSDFTIYGNNCDKIGNKIESFDKGLCDLTPSVFILQETKRKNDRSSTQNT